MNEIDILEGELGEFYTGATLNNLYDCLVKAIKFDKEKFHLDFEDDLDTLVTMWKIRFLEVARDLVNQAETYNRIAGAKGISMLEAEFDDYYLNHPFPRAYAEFDMYNYNSGERKYMNYLLSMAEKGLTRRRTDEKLIKIIRHLRRHNKSTKFVSKMYLWAKQLYNNI